MRDRCSRDFRDIGGRHAGERVTDPACRDVRREIALLVVIGPAPRDPPLAHLVELGPLVETCEQLAGRYSCVDASTVRSSPPT
jgi:hypothetical protein